MPVRQPKLAAQIKRLVVMGFAILFLLLIAVVATALVYLENSNHRLGEVVGDQNVKSALAAGMADALAQRRHSLQLLVIMDDPLERYDQWLHFNQGASEYLGLRDRFLLQTLTVDEQAQLERLDQLTLRAQARQQEVLEIVDNGNREEAIQALFGRARPAQDEVIRAVDALNQTQRAAAVAALDATTTANRQALLAMVALTGIAVVLAFLAGFLVTRRVDAQARALEEEQRKYQALFEGNLDAALVWKGERLVACNEESRRVFGITPEVREEVDIRSLVPETQPDGIDSLALFGDMKDQAEQGALVRFEWWQRRLDGAELPVEVQLRAVRVQGCELLQMVVRDLSHRKEAEERIRYLARYDALTGLPNQTLFRDQFTTLLATSASLDHKLAVGLLDLDHFKQINESFGHRVGDSLLREVAAALSGELEEGDILARMGGDEFLLLIRDAASLDGLAKRCEGLLAAIARPLPIGEHHFTVTASLGLSLFPHDAEDADGLIKQADIAMYRAKQAGGNLYRLYTESMNAEVLRHLLIKNSFGRSLRDGDFFLTYQPKMAIATGRIIGMEALVRWRHPTLGMLSPMEFIPIAEASGFICTLSDWIFRSAAHQAKAWGQAGFPALRVSVNLSVFQFRNDALVESIRRILADTGLSPDLLEFEVTESITLTDKDHSLTILRELKQLGVHISIDDFGTGYSALSYLKKYPVDTLKIDKSFMDQIPLDEERSAVATAIIQLAHSLGYSVVAEGVETREQLGFLEARGCYAIQGHYLSPAMPVEEFSRFLAHYPSDCPLH